MCYNKLNDYQLVDDILHSSVEGDVVKGMGLVDHHLERVVDEKKCSRSKSHLALRAVYVVFQVLDDTALQNKMLLKHI